MSRIICVQIGGSRMPQEAQCDLATGRAWCRTGANNFGDFTPMTNSTYSLLCVFGAAALSGGAFGKDLNVAKAEQHPYVDAAGGREGYQLAGEKVNEARVYDFYQRQADYYMAKGEVPLRRWLRGFVTVWALECCKTEPYWWLHRKGHGPLRLQFFRYRKGRLTGLTPRGPYPRPCVMCPVVLMVQPAAWCRRRVIVGGP